MAQKKVENEDGEKREGLIDSGRREWKEYL